MCLLTEWEDLTGKYLAQGALLIESQTFPVWPDLTQSISILSYHLIFYVVQKREEGKGVQSVGILLEIRISQISDCRLGIK